MIARLCAGGACKRLGPLAAALAAAAITAGSTAGCGEIVPIDPVDAGPITPDGPPVDGPPIDGPPIDSPDPGIDAIASDNANLIALSLSAVGDLTPAFDPDETAYTVGYSLVTQEVRVTAEPENPDATLTVNGAPLQPGVASDPVALAVGDQDITVLVTAPSGATKTYTITTNRGQQIAQLVYAKAAAPDAEDQFGRLLAVSGDTVAVGVPFEDSNAAGIDGDATNNAAADSGAVYIFRRTGATWAQEAYIKASNTGAGDAFAFSLDLDGDVLVVGAPAEDSAATGVNGNENSDGLGSSGAAYIFRRDGSGIWNQEAYLKSSNPDLNDTFGFGVAVSGNTVIVGCDRDDSNSTGVGGNPANNGADDSGAVYVFDFDGAEWSQSAYLKASNTGIGDRFGISVDIDGDRIVVGAFTEDSGIVGNQADNSAFNSGAAYVFERNDDQWSQAAYLKAAVPGGGDGAAAPPVDGDLFGFSVAISGDLVAVGSFREDSTARGIDGDQTNDGAAQAGAAYVFQRQGNGTWTQDAYIKASNTEADDLFGQTIAIAGELLLIGANGEDSNGTGVDSDSEDDNNAGSSGAAYLYRRAGGEWQQVGYIKASNSENGDNFGFNIDLDRDVMTIAAALEDGGTAGIGGNQGDNSQTSSGALYIFH